jgi:hypothetical protein
MIHSACFIPVEFVYDIGWWSNDVSPSCCLNFVDVFNEVKRKNCETRVCFRLV